LHITPEPKPVSVGLVALKGKLSPAAEKFWQPRQRSGVKKVAVICLLFFALIHWLEYNRLSPDSLE
jgi:hypothetical protein